MAIAERFVAICDVLGFSQLVKSTSLPTLCANYKNLLERSNPPKGQVTFGELSGAGARTLKFGVSYVVFSDTILFWSNADEWSVQVLFEHVAALITESLALMLPLRVGIAFGECEIDTDRGIYIGPAIVDAYQTEVAQLWIGGACHPSCEIDPLFRYYIIEELGLVVEYTVPTRSNAKLGMALNWVNYGSNRVSAANLRKYLHEGRTRAMSVDGQLKWDNAAIFFEWRQGFSNSE